MRALVTGGGGFLGSAIVRRLLARGDAVVLLARGRYPELEALGARPAVCDLTRPVGLDEALAGVDVVFHVASKTGVWGERADFIRVNVEGTARLLEATRRAGVTRLVYTSSPSATFSGADARGLGEAECPYPAHFEAAYPETKARAEQAVLAANGPALATTALRPHLIWGPGDPHLLPRLIARQKAGRLARVGDGQNLVALTYIDNAASAHLQAADALAPGSPNAGRPYFVTDGAPVNLWRWVEDFLLALGLGPIRRAVPRRAAWALGAVLEAAWTLFRLDGEPLMTRFVANELAASHWYDLRAAEADFGYRRVIDPDEAMARTVACFREEPP
jgi:nucleoside-diphosphate-sugar epimerase